MTLVIALLGWAGIFMLVTYFSWISIRGYMKVYLLVFYSAVFLSGVFWLFPMLKRLI